MDEELSSIKGKKLEVFIEHEIDKTSMSRASIQCAKNIYKRD